MRLAHLSNILYHQPWNIIPQGWLSLHEVFQKNIFPDVGNTDFSAFVNPRPDAEIDQNGIAHIHITGTLGKHLSQIERSCGNTGYEQLDDEITVAESKGAKAFLFHISSPGGMAAGNVEIASIIGSLEVPTLAWIDELAASAAYAIASGADRIHAAPSAQVGSIGTILPLIDTSIQWENRGIKPAYITHTGGDLKDALWPPSFSDAHKAHLQEMVDTYFGQFRGHVLSHRMIESDAMRGQTFLGENALNANLIDEVGSYTDAYNAILDRVDKASNA